MQENNPPQSQQNQLRSDAPSRTRESAPGGRQDANTAGESAGMRGASTQSGQAGSRSPSIQRTGQTGSQRPGYGLARRDQGYGVPSLFGTSGPFALLRRMEQEMDRMFEQFGVGDYGTPSSSRTGAGGMSTLWMPQVEIFERDGKLHVCTDLPGLKKEDVQVNIEDDMVTIQGERRSSDENQDQQRGFYRSERSYGSFYRTIALPEGVKGENAEATFRDGVLDITFDAPTEQRRGRTLEIKDGSSQQPAQSGSTESNRASR